MRESALVRILAPLVCQPMHASRLGNSGSSPFFHPKILLQHQVSFEFPFGGSLERSAPFIGFTPATLGQRITLFATTPNQMKFFGLKCPPFPFSDGYAAIWVALFEGGFQSTNSNNDVLSVGPPGWKMVYNHS